MGLVLEESGEGANGERCCNDSCAGRSHANAQPPAGVPLRAQDVEPPELPEGRPPTSEPQASTSTPKLHEFCLTCGETSSERFVSAPLGLRVAVVLYIGAHQQNFGGAARACGACVRACKQPLLAACESLIVAAPDLTSPGPVPFRLPVRHLSGLRKGLNALRADFTRRGSAVLNEKLFAMNPDIPSRSSGAGLTLLPVALGFSVHLSSR